MNLLFFFVLFPNQNYRVLSNENVCHFAEISYCLGFFHIFMCKTDTEWDSLYIEVSALKVDKHKCEKTVNLGFEVYFLGSKYVEAHETHFVCHSISISL